jgi:two-component system response regulator AtoC
VIFGRSVGMQANRERLVKVCATDLPILIQGEAGTGKEVLARWIHAHSGVRLGPFVKVNCAAIPGQLLESELFGYEKGAFTGAYSSKLGRAEMANGGTLLLDEIADLDPHLQAKLLQVLQDGRFNRLGDDQERRLEARVICTSNRPMEQAVRSGHFREDLYYRINVFCVYIPRLADRRDDILQLANYLYRDLCQRFDRPEEPIPLRVQQFLQTCEWNGNIRELENRIASYVLLGTDEIREEAVPVRAYSLKSIKYQADSSTPLKQITKRACRELGREVILRALEANRWNRRRTAEQLNISYRALLYKIREVGLPSKNLRKQTRESGEAVLPPRQNS